MCSQQYLSDGSYPYCPACYWFGILCPRYRLNWLLPPITFFCSSWQAITFSCSSWPAITFYEYSAEMGAQCVQLRGARATSTAHMSSRCITWPHMRGTDLFGVSCSAFYDLLILLIHFVSFKDSFGSATQLTGSESLKNESFSLHRAPLRWHWSSTTHSVAGLARGLRALFCMRWGLYHKSDPIYRQPILSQYDSSDLTFIICFFSSAFPRSWIDPHAGQAGQERLYSVSSSSKI